MSLSPQRWVAYVSSGEGNAEPEEIARFLGVLEDYTPRVEHRGGAAYLDLDSVRRLFGHPFAIVDNLHRELHRRGFAATSGLGSSKFLARAAAALAGPEEVLWVLPQGEREFLNLLPVEMWPEADEIQRTRTRDDRDPDVNIGVAGMQGMGRRRRGGIIDQMRELGMRRVGDLAAVDPYWVKRLWGEQGLVWQRQALGFDPRPVVRLLPSPEDVFPPTGLFPPESKREKLFVLSRLAAFLARKYGRGVVRFGRPPLHDR